MNNIISFLFQIMRKIFGVSVNKISLLFGKTPAVERAESRFVIKKMHTVMDEGLREELQKMAQRLYKGVGGEK